MHQQAVPAVLRGTLTLVVTYEPPPRKAKGSDISYFKGQNKEQLNQTSSSSRRKHKEKRIASQPASSGDVNIVGDPITYHPVENSHHAHHKGIKLAITEPIEPSIPSSLLSPSGAYEEAVDPKTGRTYWYNRATQDRTWIDPTTPANLTAPTPRW